MKPLLITIDGPAGAGKTTVSRRLAERLGYVYVDTGALYRGVALAAQRTGERSFEDDWLANLCKGLQFRFVQTSHGPALYMNDEDVSNGIRTEEITSLASALSARAPVRLHLLKVQRAMAKKGGVVFEGRDMGTVVFPEADIKFFLDADPGTRAVRRHRELESQGTNTTLEAVQEAMKKRDRDDSSRALAPLKPARDAISVDSTSMTIDDVVDVMMGRIDLLTK